MNSLSINEKIAEAMDMIISNRLKDIKYDKTEIGVINSIVDSKNGIYTAKLGTTIFQVYSMDVNKNYQINDVVYIKIPQNDLSQKKFIEGKVVEESSSEKNKQYIEGSPKFIFNNLSNREIGLVSQPEVEEKTLWSVDNNSENEIEIKELELQENFIEIFNTLRDLEDDNYNYLKFSANIKANFINPVINNTSDYGVKFYFINEEDSEEKIFTLSVKEFVGDPWGYNSGYFEQNVRILKEEILNFNLNKISIFQTGLFTDINDNMQIPQEVKENNIFFKDISLIFETKITNSEAENITENYKIVLNSQEKFYATDITQETFIGENIYIEASLYDSKGKELTNEEAYEFQWYKMALPTNKNFSSIVKEEQIGWILLPPFPEVLLNEEGEKISILYNNELATVSRTYASNLEELEKQRQIINEKYGVKKNKIHIMPLLEEQQLLYKLMVVKKIENNDKSILIKEIEFMVQKEKELQNQEFRNNFNDFNISPGSKQTDEDGNVFFTEFNISIPQIGIENSDNEQYVAFWYLYGINDKKQIIKKITTNSYQISNYSSSQSLSVSSNDKMVETIYRAYIYHLPTNNFIFYKEGTYNIKEEQLKQTPTLLSLSQESQVPSNYISDDSFVYKTETQEYLTLKDYILSLLHS